jgi:hypothetical protein
LTEHVGRDDDVLVPSVDCPPGVLVLDLAVPGSNLWYRDLIAIMLELEDQKEK